MKKAVKWPYISWKLWDIYGTSERISEKLEEYISMGIDLITPIFYPPKDYKTFAKEVIPLLK